MSSFRSTSSSKAARPGFSLVEVLIALTVMGVVVGAVFQVVLGARKAQALAVTQASLKVESQRVMTSMYKELMQSRRIIASANSEPAANDQGRDYFNNIASFPGLLPPLPAGLRVFPRVNPSDALIPGNQPDEEIGNTLLFLERCVEVPISGYTIIVGSAGETRVLTPQKPYRVYAYRLVAYYLAQRALPSGMLPLNGGTNFAYTLCRWQSSPYFEWGEIAGFLRRLQSPAMCVTAWSNLTGTVRNDRFFQNERIVGAIDVSQASPSLAVSQVNGAGDLVPTGELFRGHKTEMMTRFPRLTESFSMVSFNTGAAYPNFRLSGPPMAVPAYATSFNPTAVPYGFEVAISGSNSARLVLLRLALAARLHVGSHLYGMANQQIVQIVDD